MKDIDTSCTDEIVCPHCGYEFEDSYEVGENGLEFKMDCYECEKEFTCCPDYSVTYSTFKTFKIEVIEEKK